MAFENSDDQNPNDLAEERDRILFSLLTNSRSKSPLPALSGALDAPLSGALLLRGYRH